VITVTVLNAVHHSPLLAVCAALTGAAAYLQATYVSPAPVLHLCTVPCVVAAYPEGWLVFCVPCLVTVDGRQAESGGGGRRGELGRGELIALRVLRDVAASSNEQLLRNAGYYILSYTY
jgi:hypothetical protein